MVKVLVVGGGGREHELVKQMSKCSEVDKVYCAPGNAGTEQEQKTENVDIGAEFRKDIGKDELARQAQ